MLSSLRRVFDRLSVGRHRHGTPERLMAAVRLPLKTEHVPCKPSTPAAHLPAHEHARSKLLASKGKETYMKSYSMHRGLQLEIDCKASEPRDHSLSNPIPPRCGSRSLRSTRGGSIPGSKIWHIQIQTPFPGNCNGPNLRRYNMREASDVEKVVPCN